MACVFYAKTRRSARGTTERQDDEPVACGVRQSCAFWWNSSR